MGIALISAIVKTNKLMAVSSISAIVKKDNRFI
ncbi:hypothetical protein Ga0123461_0566 [Mariprofundus aestuarium]|uniref:Uncharacterized protein n=1 Tax=Mariprofundus aestuarium TaxID=1921086 RepID=A0A2K8KZN3_MARES|nr:hypothetical protein Ga0123461_0566 [Mariprofundus aestuarium]